MSSLVGFHCKQTVRLNMHIRAGFPRQVCVIKEVPGIQVAISWVAIKVIGNSYLIVTPKQAKLVTVSI